MMSPIYALKNRLPSRASLVLIAFAAALASCSGRSVLPASLSLAHPVSQRTIDPVFLAGSPIPDSQIDANIDPNLPTDERKELHDVMVLLPPARRRNVTVYELDGRIFATRPELTAKVVTYTLVPGTKNLFRNKDGATLVAPERSYPSEIVPMAANSSVDCNSGTDTGAFRRVCSVSGYAGTEVSIDPLPCAAGIMANNDTPYLLIGGWSPNDIAVDSGFQYSPANDYYTPFFTRQGGQQMNLQGPIPCWNGYDSSNGSGQADVSLTMLSNTQLVVAADMTENNPDGTSSSWSWSQTFTVPKSDGWTTSGNGEIWKRGTFIAQQPSILGCSIVPCMDGSDLGWSSSNPEMFYFKNAALGTYGKSGGYVSYTWHPWQTYSGAGGYLNNPNDPLAIWVNYVDSSNECEGIDLCGNC